LRLLAERPCSSSARAQNRYSPKTRRGHRVDRVLELPWPFSKLIKRRHATWKAYVHDWLEPDGPVVNFFSATIITLVVISLASLALETEASRSDTPFPAVMLPIVRVINYIVVWAFALEFGLRFWSEGENPVHAGWR